MFKKKNLKSARGQALIEVVIAIALGGIFLGAATFAISAILTANKNNRNATVATSLVNEFMDNVRAYADANWVNIYNLNHASSSHYYLNTSSSPFTSSGGNQTVTVEGLSFTRYFYVDNVSRNSCGTGSITTLATTTCSSGPGNSGIADDPSTQKVTIVVTWPQAATGLTVSEYFTRSRAQVFSQANWSGGPGQETFSTTSDTALVNNLFASSTNITYSSAGIITITSIESSATGTIDATSKYAWGENVGWLNFGTSQGNVIVSNTELTGYAWGENVGWLSLNCSNTSSCDSISYRVTNDGNGNLAGYAWGENIGWVNFGSFTSSTVIDASGNFTGYAWGENIGWLSLNCANNNSCGTSNYKVLTTWTPSSTVTSFGEVFSSVYDTQKTGGTAPNTIMWTGTQPTGASVKFQIASSNCLNGATNSPTCNSGTWSYQGTDGSNSTYYITTGPNVPAQLRIEHNNKRYLRYRVRLEADSVTPIVGGVILNWSP